ncbi:MAG TPA: hypothetical protein VET89_07690 [Stellaceae bacterium]|nr:hypothetical protein [Stellaceae bacterium]
MSSGVFVLRDAQTLIPMQPSNFASEEDFQRLLANFPALLAGERIDPKVPRRWILISREKSIPSEENGAARWSVDHLFLDQDGVPTLVEVKRSTDTRIRREVVGQMLDYAANCVVYWPIEELRLKFEVDCAERGEDPSEAIERALGPERDAAAFWEQVKTNLRAGKVRMLFVADQIPTELRRIVEFLNEQMDPAEVLALELRQFEGEGLKTLVPMVYGQTQEARQNKGVATPQRQWDLPAIYEELKQKFGIGAFDVAVKTKEWMDANGINTWFGKGSKIGSMGPEFVREGERFYPAFLSTDGRVWINFNYLRKPPFDDENKRRELLRRINEIDGVDMPDSTINSNRSIPLAILSGDTALRKLLSALDWFKDELRRS